MMNDEKEFLKLTETGRKFLEESMKYESPITKICGQIHSEIIKQDEEHLMCSVNQSVGYQVDKDELIKALQYDRDQYRKGYTDGLNAGIVIPEGATNGDVIKSIYCQYGLVIRFRQNGEVIVDMTKLKNNGMIPNMAFDEDWWNTPYKKEVYEEKNNQSIKIGDVVRVRGYRKPVVVISVCKNTNEVRVMNYLGDNSWEKVSDCVKTGKHYTQLDEMFEDMQDG